MLINHQLHRGMCIVVFPFSQVHKHTIRQRSQYVVNSSSNTKGMIDDRLQCDRGEQLGECIGGLNGPGCTFLWSVWVLYFENYTLSLKGFFNEDFGVLLVIERVMENFFFFILQSSSFTPWRVCQMVLYKPRGSLCHPLYVSLFCVDVRVTECRT